MPRLKHLPSRSTVRPAAARCIIKQDRGACSVVPFAGAAPTACLHTACRKAMRESQANQLRAPAMHGDPKIHDIQIWYQALHQTGGQRVEISMTKVSSLARHLSFLNFDNRTNKVAE